MMREEIIHDVLYAQHRGHAVNQYIVVDVETTMKGKTKFSADPFAPENELLQIGYTIMEFDPVTKTMVGGNYVSIYTDIEEGIGALNNLLEQQSYHIVGWNVKFDLHYLHLNGMDMSNVVCAYDVQNMYYLKYHKITPSLNEAAEHLFNLTKDEKVTDLLNAGVKMEDIPEEMVSNYLRQDVMLTADLFEVLRIPENQTKEKTILQNVMARTTMALFTMEFNGLQVDKKKLYDMSIELTERKGELEKWLGDELAKHVPDGAKIESLTSTRTLNYLLLGKELTFMISTKVGKYKNGKDKFKKMPIVSQVKTHINKNKIYDAKELAKENPNLGLPMNDEILKRIKEKATNSNQVNYIDAVLELRKIDKLLSTYVEPIGNYLEVTFGDYIRPTYNQSNTATGRLSSTNPNGQNMPPSIDALFTCDENEFIFSVDFKQLEVCGAALLSGDEALRQDIYSGVDIHREIGKLAGFQNMDKSTRRLIKSVVFGTIYGGSPRTLTKQSGVPISDVLSIQKAMWTKYPKLEQYYKEYADKVKYAEVIGTKVKDGHVCNVVQIPSLTGRTYQYEQYPNKYGVHMTVGYSWPQICNYPIQGVSTGDIVPLYISILYVLAKDYEDLPMALTRTIHDNVESRWNYPEGELSNTYAQAVKVHKNAVTLTEEAFFRWTGNTYKIGLELDIEPLKEK